MWKVFRYLLLPFSLLYLIGIKVRAALYRAGIFKSHKVDAAVISIGNITLGGSGKTPLTVATAKLLKAEGVKVAVVSRGYGATYRGRVLEITPEVGVLGGGDEPAMMARELKDVPVIIGKKRKYTCEHAVQKFGSRAIVLDDAFQHLAIHRDLDIIIMDADRNLSGEFLFPAGVLREPAAALKRADAIVIKSRQGMNLEQARQFINAYAPGANIFTATVTPTKLVEVAGENQLEPSSIKGKRVAGFCGLANNESFRATLKALGAEVAFFHGFNDHHRYSHHELDELLHDARAQGAEMAVTTAKDAVKIAELEDVNLHLPVWELKIELKIDREGEYKDLITNAIRSGNQ